LYAFPGLHHEDWRYPMFRERAGRWEFVVDLVTIHLIPTLLVFAGMLPVYVAVTRPGGDIGWLTDIAFVVGLAAVILELVADVQMHRFIRDRRDGEAMDRGLWSWSRHPNYFGEFSFWVSLALFGVAVAPSDAWWVCLGALGTGGMFLGGSIPMMETRSLERRPDYQDVVDRISRFVPRPPRRA
jgi:steroid 5-alpha reductase family enzyme